MRLRIRKPNYKLHSAKQCSAIILSVIMLNVVMLSVIMLSVIMLSVINLSVIMVSFVLPSAWTNFSLQDEPWARVFNFRSGCMHTMHSLPGVATQPNLELKTRPKQLLGSLPLVITLPAQWYICSVETIWYCIN
jgi:hypothetical protein